MNLRNIVEKKTGDIPLLIMYKNICFEIGKLNNKL